MVKKKFLIIFSLSILAPYHYNFIVMIIVMSDPTKEHYENLYVDMSLYYTCYLLRINRYR